MNATNLLIGSCEQAVNRAVNRQPGARSATRSAETPHLTKKHTKPKLEEKQKKSSFNQTIGGSFSKRWKPIRVQGLVGCQSSHSQEIEL